MNNKQQGFTLIEMMIVVAIMGILASIVMPAYQNYLEDGKATEATSNLSDCRVKAEQYFQDNQSYEGIVCAPADAKNFTYTVASNATTYTLTATGKDAAGMTGYLFTINQDNSKTSTYDGSATAACWLGSSTGSC